jgi:DNA primase
MSDPVLSLLNEKGIAFKVSGKDYLIKCLNPDHEDSNPSCRVDRVSGITHCFSCGWKRNLFKHFGIFTNFSSIRVAKLKEKLKELKTSMADLELPNGAIPYTREFRGISTTTLKHFGAFHTLEDEELKDRIIFPIKDALDRTVVFVGRHTLSNSNPRYLNFPKHSQIPLFPVKLDDHYTSIVLVEGIFDMLNLYDKGLRNVVACFGTSTLKGNTATKLLPFKTQGITKIYIMFDGDTAGSTAAKELKPLVEECGFETTIIELQDGMDPGDMNQEYVSSIKEYVNK